ncbi:hypothetical protein GLOIN_2v1470117 [Rhizophagus clarus]|uniref:Uncharacterized protein n=1 Tax=Rhizophagus clarus TaxID=94130 RepID=A0A8H3QVR1_9GLOM|nr:hypothetical protein GLOIN_2v1470117 [Rhizophagus clarus]
MAGLTFSHASNCSSFYEEGYLIAIFSTNNTRKHVVVDKYYEIWPKEATPSTVQHLNIIPFKEMLPPNLPETINTNNEQGTANGSVEYKLSATVNLNERWQLFKPFIEIDFPLKKATTMGYKDCSSFYPHKLQGKFKNFLEYTFELPHNKKFNLGTHVYIPMKIKYLKTSISVERIKSYLMTYMDFRFNTNRNYRIEKITNFPDVPKHKIINKYEVGECNHTINFFISRDSRPNYSSQLITITNELHIKICLGGTDEDFDINTSVTVAKFTIRAPTTVPISADNSCEESESEDSEDDDQDILEKDSKDEPLKDKQIIQQWKLNYGLSFDENNNIHFSKKAVVSDDNELEIDEYDGKPMVYTCINYNDDYDDISIQPLDICINFPVVKITYNSEPVESLFSDDKEKLHEIYGHFLAKKFLAGGQLFIKGFNLVTPDDINLLKFHLIMAYNSALNNNKNPFTNLSTLQFAPRIETISGKRIRTLKELNNWINNLYQENITLEIIHYDDLISISQLRVGKLPSDDFETFKVSQPGIANFKEKLNLEEWVVNVNKSPKDNQEEEAEVDSCVILTKFVKNFHLLQGLIVNKYHEMKVSEKFAVNFIKLPKLKSSNDFYLEVNKPKTITNKINPFSRSDDLDDRFNDIPLMIKYEQYKVLLDIDNIEPSEEFKSGVEQALNNVKPFDALQSILGEYGHLFPLRIVLGNKIVLSTTSPGNNYRRIDIKSSIESSLKPYLDKDSYFVTQKGDVIEVNKENNLSNWFEDNKNNLEIIELDKIIPLYDILEVAQQSKVHTIIRGYDNKQDEFKVIMTGIINLKDLNDENTEHYKRIDIEPSLEDEKYEVFGSIISGNDSLVEEHFVKFELRDLNGFYAIIKSSTDSNINIKECHILWMIIGRPSELSVFSPKNREFLVQRFNISITTQPTDESYYHIKTPFPLSHGCCISVNAYYPPSNYEPMNDIKLIEWSYNSIKFQISKSNDPDETSTNIDLRICVLYSDNKMLKIDNDNREKEYPLSTKKGYNFPLELIGHILTDDKLNENLFLEINNEINYIIEQPFMNNDIKLTIAMDFGTTSSGFAYAYEPMNNIIINEDWSDQFDEGNELNLSSNLVYEQAIDYFKKIREFIKNTVLKPEIDFFKNVLIALAIPSKLSHQEKIMIRKCMCKAELIDSEDSEKLLLITGIEAAAIDCMNTIKEKSISDFLVVNCGSEIVELTLRRIVNSKLVEKSIISSKLCGSNYVDKEFLIFISKKVGSTALKNLETKHYDQLQCLIKKFRKKVKNKDNYNVYEMDLEKICPDIKQYVTDSSYLNELKENEWKIKISYDDVKLMFDPIVEQIIQLIYENLNSSCLTIFLAGSLGKSRHLRTRIEQEFQQHIIIVPRQPLATVVSGTLEYGLNKNSLYSRVMDVTYGVGTSHSLKDDNSNERQFFNRLVSKGTEVHVNQEFEFKLDYKDQPKFYIELFSTFAQDAIFCDEPGVSKVGTIGIDIPESWHSQSVNLVLFLGQIEIHPFIKNEGGEFLMANFKITLI